MPKFTKLEFILLSCSLILVGYCLGGIIDSGIKYLITGAMNNF